MPWSKKWSMWLLNLFCSLPKFSKGDDSYKRALIVEPFGMGDVISLEPLVTVLTNSGWKVVICARETWRPLLDDGKGQIEWIDCRFPWSGYASKSKYGISKLAGLRQTIRQIKACGEGAVGIDPRGDARSLFVMRLAKVRNLYSVNRYLGYDAQNWKSSAKLVSFDISLKRWQANLLLATELGLKDEALDAHRPRLSHLSEVSKANSGPIGFICASPWAGKDWPPGRWRQLAERLTEINYDLVGLCGPGQAEETTRSLGHQIAIQECNSIEDWARTLQSCRLIVSIDTGPMHMADALGVPVIALYSTAFLPLWAPSMKHSRWICKRRPEEICYCHPIEQAVTFARELMARITVDNVYETVIDLITDTK